MPHLVSEIRSACGKLPTFLLEVVTPEGLFPSLSIRLGSALGTVSHAHRTQFCDGRQHPGGLTISDTHARTHAHTPVFICISLALVFPSPHETAWLLSYVAQGSPTKVLLRTLVSSAETLTFSHTAAADTKTKYNNHPLPELKVSPCHQATSGLCGGLNKKCHL